MVDNTGQLIGKLAPLYNCIGYGVYYVEMQWDNSTTECGLLVLDLKLRETKKQAM